MEKPDCLYCYIHPHHISKPGIPNQTFRHRYGAEKVTLTETLNENIPPLISTLKEGMTQNGGPPSPLRQASR
eukprot:jgi/Botrbrau1/2410/Bobra.0395s0039.1